MSNGSPRVPSFWSWTARAKSLVSTLRPICERLYWMICARNGEAPRFDSYNTTLPSPVCPCASFFAALMFGCLSGYRSASRKPAIPGGRIWSVRFPAR